MSKTDFNKPLSKYFESIKTTIMHSSHDSNIDLERIKSISTGKSDMLEIFDDTRFTFDQITLVKIKTMRDREQIFNFIEKISKNIFKIDKIKQKNMKFDNIIFSCRSSKSDVCEKNKLIISPEKLKMYIGIFTDQLLNPFTEKYITSPVFTNQVIDYFKFIHRPTEKIIIEYL
jgi:SepF-like predicted cell division protein (DUF552 family)